MPSLSPEEGLRSLRVKLGLRAELVANEPLVVDPVAIDWGTDGKHRVCEMRDYPTSMDGNWKPGGRINVPENTDGDGNYDKSAVLLDGLPFPTGVMPGQDGGKVDVRKVVFQGFATENYQTRVNGVNGLIGGMIRGTASGREVNIGGCDFRIKPDLGVLEPASGPTRQGRVHDDEGNQFGGNSSVLLQHCPLPGHAARRNPRITPPAPVVYAPETRTAAASIRPDARLNGSITPRAPIA